MGEFVILLIQEHHLSQTRVAKICKFLKGMCFYDWVLAYGPTGMQGGLAIACSEKWASLIIDKVFLQGGRAQFIVLKILGKKVGFLNVYAPNSTRGRAQFWCQLCNYLPVMDHWCIVGDFNMLEDPSDRMGGSTITISGAELAEWEKLCFKFSLQDLWFM